MSFQHSTNPANGEIIRSYNTHNAVEVQEKLALAHSSFQEWRRTAFAMRAEKLRRVAEILRSGKDHYAQLIALEMGKPLKEALAEIEKCATSALYFCENGQQMLADQLVATEYRKSYVTFQPIGIILGIMPWNFPFWQVLRYAFPALLSGNVCLLKHASNTPGCAMAIEDLFTQAGFPRGTFQTLLIPAAQVESLIADKRIAAVTLTGSTPAGSQVAATSGKYLKKTVLELGGSDPYLILEDCDIEHAIKTCAASRMTNCGQSCVSAKRMIVVKKHLARFEQGIKEIFAAQKIGDPLDPTTTIGPMSRADLRDELHKQIQNSINSGAKLLAGGSIPAGKGAFYPLTILSAVTAEMPCYREEMFGPVAVIIPAEDEAAAIKIANDSEFGLGGAVFTQNLEKGERIAREIIESGSCFVNMMVRSDPRLPFGGIKSSGYGRELSAFGMHEFVNIKSVVVA